MFPILSAEEQRKKDLELLALFDPDCPQDLSLYQSEFPSFLDTPIPSMNNATSSTASSNLNMEIDYLQQGSFNSYQNYSSTPFVTSNNYELYSEDFPTSQCAATEATSNDSETMSTTSSGYHSYPSSCSSPPEYDSSASSPAPSILSTDNEFDFGSDFYYDEDTYAALNKVVAEDEAKSGCPITCSMPIPNASSNTTYLANHRARSNPEDDELFGVPKIFNCPMCPRKYFNRRKMKKHAFRHFLRRIVCPNNKCGYRAFSFMNSYKHFIYNHGGSQKELMQCINPFTPF